MKNIFETEMNVNAVDEMFETIVSYNSIAEAVAEDEMYADMLEQFDDEITEFYYGLRRSVKTAVMDEDDFSEALIELKKIIKTFFIERIIEKAVSYNNYEVVSAAEKYLSGLGIHSKVVNCGCPFDSSEMAVEYAESTTDKSNHKTVKEISCPMYYYKVDGRTKIVNKMKAIIYKYEA